MDKWDRILSADNVVVGLQAQHNIAAIRELAAVLGGEEAIRDHKRFLAEVIRREQQVTTGIGHGVAVPHIHEDIIERQILALGISQEGIEFGAVDGQPVHIVALLATPKKHHKQHMELLAALSRLLQHQEVRDSLLQAGDGAEVVGIFTNSKV